MLCLTGSLYCGDVAGKYCGNIVGKYGGKYGTNMLVVYIVANDFAYWWLYGG